MNKKLLVWCLEELYPDFWNIRNSVPNGMWRNCDYDLRLNDIIPFLAFFQILYVKHYCKVIGFKDGKVIFKIDGVKRLEYEEQGDLTNY